ncbi:MAG: hypothetical protein NDP13_04550 [Crenarchaeota archaeon]|nr:hypothetical protein [Thermoproteota archaeon]MCR8454756.1 hypothetical protein [Thermoproteota archaeon]MCR8501164.1 hypothetical protein [Thermoproteota archaeon]
MGNRNSSILNNLLKRRTTTVARKILKWDKSLGIVVVKDRHLLVISKLVSDILNRWNVSCKLVGTRELSDAVSKYSIIITVSATADWDKFRQFLELPTSKVIIFVCGSAQDIPIDLRENIAARVVLSASECEIIKKKAQRMYTLNLIKHGVNKSVAKTLIRNSMDLLSSEKFGCINNILRTWGFLVGIHKDLSEELLPVVRGILNILSKVCDSVFPLDLDHEITIKNVAISSEEELKILYEFNGEEFSLNIWLTRSLEKLLDICKFAIFMYEGDTELAISDIFSTMGYFADRKNTLLIYPLRKSLVQVLQCVRRISESSSVYKLLNLDLLQAFLRTSIAVDLGENGVIPMEYVVSSCMLYGLVLGALKVSPAVLEKRNDFLRKLISSSLSIGYSSAKEILDGIFSRVQRRGIKIADVSERDIVLHWGELLRDIANEIKFRYELLT